MINIMAQKLKTPNFTFFLRIVAQHSSPKWVEAQFHKG